MKTWNRAYVNIRPGQFKVVWQQERNNQLTYTKYNAALDNITLHNGDCLTLVTTGPSSNWWNNWKCSSQAYHKCGFIDVSPNPNKWTSIVKEG